MDALLVFEIFSNFDDGFIGDDDEAMELVFSNLDFREMCTAVEVGDLDVDLEIDGNLILIVFELALRLPRGGDAIGTVFCIGCASSEDTFGVTDLDRSGNFIL